MSKKAVPAPLPVPAAPADWMVRAEDDPTGNWIERWSTADHPRPSLTVRRTWPNANYRLARWALNSLTPEDRRDPYKRGEAFRRALKLWKSKDKRRPFTAKGLHQSLKQHYCLECFKPLKSLKDGCNCPSR